jgi:biopolymer transport protein ExbB/TolQ
MLGGKDFKAAVKFASQSSSAMSNMIGAGLVRLGRRQPREEIEYAMEEGLLDAMPRLEKRTQYLATLANVSTLLGLLGTIIGLIAAFTAVASADPAQKASLLSQSISVAMNTTAFGLIAAIPLLLIHSILQTKTNEIVDSFEMAGIKVMNIISDRAPVAASNNNPVAPAQRASGTSSMQAAPAV